MAFQKFGNFLMTDAGRKFCMYTAAGISLSVFSVKAIPNTFLINKYKELIHLYDRGIAVPVPSILKERFDKAVNLIGIPEKEKFLYSPFMCFGFEVRSIGTGHSRFGGFVGLPINYVYKSTSDVDRIMVRVNNESVPWEMEEGQQLLNSMLVTEEAQLYGIAREIKMLASPKFLLDTTISLFFTISTYSLCYYLNNRFKMHEKLRGVRFVMYGLVAAFMFANYALVKDQTQVYYEQKVDRFLKEKDPIFVKGGKDFYENVLLRNQALRKLLGKAGESHYSVLGNENSLIRQKHVPPYQRKEFFEGKTESYM